MTERREEVECVGGPFDGQRFRLAENDDRIFTLATQTQPFHFPRIVASLNEIPASQQRTVTGVYYRLYNREGRRYEGIARWYGGVYA